MNDLPGLTRDLGERFARIALANIAQEYPHRLDHVMTGDADVVAPRVLHPAFHGAYDWHSCVHMHWLAARMRRRFPECSLRADVDVLFERHFAAAPMAAERAYLDRPQSTTFERPYGWAWLIALAGELARHGDGAAIRWRGHLARLAAEIEQRLLHYLARLAYPIRHGVHGNTSFAMLLTLTEAQSAGSAELAGACATRALHWFGEDRADAVAWEPSGADFLSPTLTEAALMAQVLRAADFASWLERFLPGLAAGAPAGLAHPVRNLEPDDPQAVHLDGLNLSRAWCWRLVAEALPPQDARRDVALGACARHLEAGARALENPAFVAAHWLASFAVLALEPPQQSGRVAAGLHA